MARCSLNSNIIARPFVRALLKGCAAIGGVITMFACTYQFNVDYHEDTKIVVFNGDIIAGSESVIYGYVTKGFGNGQTGALSPGSDQATAYYGYDTFAMEGYLESEDGARIKGTLETDNGLRFDTSNLDISKRYRLHLKNTANGSEYMTDWSDVLGAPVIDSLSYYINYEDKTLCSRVSVSAQDTPYISITSSYSWKVTPWAKTYFGYDEPDESYPNGQVVLRNEYPLFCYTPADDIIRTFATVTMKEGKLVNYTLDEFPRDDRRISGTLRLRLKTRQISKQSYLYWQNLEKTSSMTGDLFTPTPSSMRGNIINVSDENEMVLGYIGMSLESHKDLYIKHEDHMFYRAPESFQLTLNSYTSDGIVPESLWYQNYTKGNRPYKDIYDDMGFFMGYTWINKICLDCTLAGGTPEIPEDWNE